VAAARYIGEDSHIYVLYRGTVVERGLADDVIMNPTHPYTQSLLSAIPILKGLEQEAEESVVPLAPLVESQSDTGCLFVARCPFARSECQDAAPQLIPVPHQATEHHQACLFPQARAVMRGFRPR